MRKIIFTLIAALGLCAQADAAVKFKIIDGIDNQALIDKMEQQTGLLLTAVNNACDNNTDLNLSGLDISNTAIEALASCWENVHFRTEDDFIGERCLTRKYQNGTTKAYQFRNIGLSMHPIDDAYDSGSRRELVIDFTPTGQINDVNFCMDNSIYTKMLAEGEMLKDVERRMQILAWCEKLSQAYNNKDSIFMERVFSDDALIITGRVISNSDKGAEIKSKKKVEYINQTKRQYLDNLRKVFDRQNHNGYINVIFDDFRVMRHPSRPDYYYVTLIQKWHSKGYSDEGILTLVWDFNDEDRPKIMVRTWQPMGELPFGPEDIEVL